MAEGAGLIPPSKEKLSSPSGISLDASDESEEILLFEGRSQAPSRNKQEQVDVLERRFNPHHSQDTVSSQIDSQRVWKNKQASSSSVSAQDLNYRQFGLDSSTGQKTCSFGSGPKREALADCIGNIELDDELGRGNLRSSGKASSDPEVGDQVCSALRAFNIRQKNLDTILQSAECVNPALRWRAVGEDERSPNLGSYLSEMEIGDVGRTRSQSITSRGQEQQRPVPVLEDVESLRPLSQQRRRQINYEVQERMSGEEELMQDSPSPSESLLPDVLESRQKLGSMTPENDGIEVLREAARQYATSKDRRPGSGINFTTLLGEDPEVEQYGDFDVMDRERESLQSRRKKHRKPHFDISDSELEASMLLSWEKDRSRKKEKKQIREALHTRGLIGKKGALDSNPRLPDGMTWDEIKEELKDFLLSNRTTLKFVPLDKRNRRIIHEIANRFNVKSVSKGSGDQRHPCLTKTSRTKAFNEEVFLALENRFARRFLPRMDKRKATETKTTRGTGAPASTIAYRDGEIVGATAPELDSGNRGRLMLEKMGWSNGTALGPLNNKGLLLPISHIVKNTRTGLG